MRSTKACFVVVAWITILASQGARAQLMRWYTVDGRTRAQMAQLGLPSKEQPFLGLFVSDVLDANGINRCQVGEIFQRGPILESDAARWGDTILAMNDVAIHSTEQFGQLQQSLTPGQVIRLRVKRDPARWPGKDTGVEETVSVRVGSRAEWATPLDWIRPSSRRISPDQLIPVGPDGSRLEQFLNGHLDRQGIRQPVDKLLKYLADAVENFYGANMLDRVAYAFYRPTRLAELQASITEPLARIVDRNQGNPWAVSGPILAEAARNLDVTFSAQKPGQINFADPRQALKDAAGLVGQAQAHLRRAFADIDPAHREELASSLPQLVDRSNDPHARQRPPTVRARQASMHIDYASLFAAAGALASWTVLGEPLQSGKLPVAVPKELEGAVKGDVLAVERIEERWYVYGGSGPNEYDLSQIDAVIDPGGNDRYRYSSKERPKAQLVVDWAGNDVYSSEDGVAGPASAMLGVSILIDHQGNDRYEGGFRSCGAGLMGIGLIMDHAGNDAYRGTEHSLGYGRYGFGGIVDLGDGSDVYSAQESSEAYGATHGFGLTLDEAGRDVYRAVGTTRSAWGVPTAIYSACQGVGYGDSVFDTGGIGLLCDLAGNDRYETGEVSQGAGWLFGMGILYDRSGNDFYSGDRYSQGASAHGGVGILADDGGDDTYWSMGQAEAWDFSLGLLIDQSGNDSYQAMVGQGSAAQQAVGWLIDLEGEDRYVLNIRSAKDRLPGSAVDAGSASQGESGYNRANYKDCQCFSWSLLLDAGGTHDLYSRTDRSDGMAISTGSLNPKEPQLSTLHGLFIDTIEKMTFWR